MLINIKEELFYKLTEFIKNKDMAMYKQLKKIKPIIPNSGLIKAREIKTKRAKQLIKKTIQDIIKSNTKPTKYKIHQKSKVSYLTLAKYYDDILNEFYEKR
jgi:hypothetical protein